MSSSVKRIVVIGSECTGKTTLARQLADYFKTSWSWEYAREYLEAKGPPLSFDDVEPIARGQLISEDGAASQADRVVFHDTNLLSTMLYSRHYYGDIPAMILPALAERPADLYLLCDIDLPWEPDGAQRDRPGNRVEMHHLFESALRENGFPFRLIRGEGEARLAVALMSLAPALAESA